MTDHMHAGMLARVSLDPGATVPGEVFASLIAPDAFADKALYLLERPFRFKLLLALLAWERRAHPLNCCSITGVS